MTLLKPAHTDSIMDSVSLGFETFYGYMASTLSYRVVAICLLSVPVTHVAGLLAAGNGGSGLAGLKGHGGNRFKLLAACSYVSAAGTPKTTMKVFPLLSSTCCCMHASSCVCAQ